MTVKDDIGPGESLGRDVFSSSQARRADRGRILPNVFLGREGDPRLSVDRLDFASPGEATEIADRVAIGRSKPFFGWAVVKADAAASNGRQVTASPQTDNPYHADIILPDTAVEDRDEQKRHAQELADEASWRARDS